MPDKPLVSIIIPVYNAEKYLAATLDSALAQTWPNTEIIAVNDGSTDGSMAIVEAYTKKGVVLINQTNKGASAAKQAGLDLARGEFIQFLDADDILDAGKISIQMAALQAAPGKIAVCKTAHFFNDTGYVNSNIPEDDNFFIDYLNEPLNFLIKLYGGFDLVAGMIQPNAFLTPVKIIKTAGPWNSNISPCTDEDGEYFTRVILKSEGIVYQPQILNYYRKSRNQQSLSGTLNIQTCSNLIDSIWLKHQHLLACAGSAGQSTAIHNATNLFLDQVKVQIYFESKAMVDKIEAYQRKLSPALKPVHDKMGGKTINLISKIMGWKFARKLQHLYQQKNKLNA